MSTGLYIGAMTGTSMDGIDVVLLEISESALKTKAHLSQPIPSTLRKSLLSLCSSGEDEIQRCGEANIQLGKCIATAVNSLIAENKLKPKEILAIGSHGQTVRHSIDSNTPFTLQIGDPSTIAQLTGITTVADFRMADIAAGGQGAPLAPSFHQVALSSQIEARAIINLGGIANITTLVPNRDVTGYDTGPANTLLDQWIFKFRGEPFDREGAWARSGKIIDDLLNEMLRDPYFSAPSPKSTGREYFNLNWIEQYLTQSRAYRPEDIQRTLVELTVVTLAEQIERTPSNTEALYLCGGGVNNTFLCERLRERLQQHRIYTTGELGIDPQHVEAAAFAWMAHRTIQGLTSNLPSVTGAEHKKVLGAIYQAV